MKQKSNAVIIVFDKGNKENWAVVAKCERLESEYYVALEQAIYH